MTKFRYLGAEVGAVFMGFTEMFYQFLAHDYGNLAGVGASAAGGGFIGYLVGAAVDYAISIDVLNEQSLEKILDKNKSLIKNG